jgi:Zn finger protein HypA/HybF involved in hydrogenase expression
MKKVICPGCGSKKVKITDYDSLLLAEDDTIQYIDEVFTYFKCNQCKDSFSVLMKLIPEQGQYRPG